MIIHIKGKYPIMEWKVRGTKSLDIWNLCLWGDERFSCDCPSFVYKMRHTCKHTQNKRLELEQNFGNIKNYIRQLEEYKTSK